jgi:chromosome segregation ATPase
VTTKWIDAEMAQKRVRDVERERDELRAQLKRWEAIDLGKIDALKELQAEVERLRVIEGKYQLLVKNQERLLADLEVNQTLRAKLERTQHWLDEFQGKVAEQTIEIMRLQAEVERLREERGKREADFEPLLNEILQLRAENENLKAELYGFVDCAEKRVWPAGVRLRDARILLHTWLKTRAK